MITLTRLAAAQYKGIQSIDLSFPERGSFLIEGRNEAGKSTLFDAVHFGLYGVPLVGDLADAIHYGGDEMAVQLGFRIGGTELRVRRNIRQTAKTLRAEADLEVIRGDDVEVVKGARAVSSRLQQELGGLTSEALLNSCLVAQKQLGRLETLSRSSREDALTVLLNLGKLSDVHSRLRVKPEDETRLRQAQARVELARLSSRLAEVDAERGRLERTRRLVDLRDALDQLHLVHEQVGHVTTQAASHEERLLAVREQLADLARLKDRRSHWQRLYDLTQRAESAGQEVRLAEERVREAEDAAGRLPPKEDALRRIQGARDNAQALIDARGRMTNLSAEAARIAKRLEDRAQLTVRCERLTAQLDELRRQRRSLQGNVMQLAPLTTELEASRARLVQFQQLAEQLRVLKVQRDALASLEERLATRLEVDSEIEQAGTALLASQRTLITLEEQREKEEQRRNLEERAECLARWIELARAREAAVQTRRLLDDLALAVSGVEHIGVAASSAQREAESEAAGLHLSLVADHPLTGALVLRLQLWAGGGRLVEVRPANKLEAAGLEAGALPSLSAAGAEAQQGDLTAVEDSLVSLGEPVPASLRDAARRLDRLETERRAPRPPFDSAAYQRALAAVAADERTLTTVKAKGAGLAEAAILRRQVASAAKLVAGLEQRCTELARHLKLSGRTTDAAEAELPGAINAEQERSNQLSVSAGQREGLMAQIAILDRNGKERATELEECMTDLKADSDASLQDARAQVEKDRKEAESDSARLFESISTFLCEHHVLVPEHERENPTTIRDLLQRQVEALSAEVAVLEGQAGQLEGATQRAETARELAAGLSREIAQAGAALNEEDRPDAGTADDHL
ncbi:MAG TPA: AAA family ATPase, partial [Chloroflexota bacterium]|nr:AAA family ATPase [Chloroflexota bacterium]